MIIGIDLDNTIVCYEFNRLLNIITKLDMKLEKSKLENKLVEKNNLRDYLRENGKEDVWIEIQGYAYGKCMKHAYPFPGVIDFLIRCKKYKGIDLYIISHRTKFPFKGPKVDLHKAAYVWLEDKRIYDFIPKDNIYFEFTKQEKLNRISNIRCDYFIDDLPEFLTDSNFPKIKRILFDPNGNHRNHKYYNDNLYYVNTWKEIEDIVIK